MTPVTIHPDWSLIVFSYNFNIYTEFGSINTLYLTPFIVSVDGIVISYVVKLSLFLLSSSVPDKINGLLDTLN